MSTSDEKSPSLDVAQMDKAIWKSLHDHWRSFLVEGIILIALGAAAIAAPAFATVTFAIVLGWVFFIGGVVGLVATLAGRRAPGFWWALLSALVMIAAGAFLAFWPLKGALSLTLVLAAFLIADGVFTVLFGLEHRRALSQRWGFFLFNGILDLVLAGVIVFALPGSAFWVLGIIIGVDLLFGGFSLVALAIEARRERTA